MKLEKLRTTLPKNNIKVLFFKYVREEGEKFLTSNNFRLFIVIV